MIDPTRFAAAHPELVEARRLLLGYSGGLDSTVLLHLVWAAFPQADLLALHVHHGLSPFADDWQQHCARQCARWGIPFQAERVTLAAGGLEAAARSARYEVYRRHLQAGDLLLQAHHADDQAETVLFRLLRSAGSRGLAGIPASRGLGLGRLLRPLLALRRAELEEYAHHHQLEWIEDESNSEDRFDRNYLRLNVLPLLEQRWPHAITALTTSAANARQDQLLLEEWARESLLEAAERPERVGWSLDLAWFEGRSVVRRNHLLRSWAELRGLPVPGTALLSRFEPELLAARRDARPDLHWRGASLRRFHGRLYLLGEEVVADRVVSELPWPNFPSALTLPDGSELRAYPDSEGPLYLSSLARLVVRFRQGGERCTPHWRDHSHPLKKLLQEVKLEPWLRDRVPLLYCDDEMVAVADLWACKPFTAADTVGRQPGGQWRLCWYRSERND